MRFIRWSSDNDARRGSAQECLGMDLMLDVLSKRDPKIYWGTATTGAPHIGNHAAL